MKSRSTWHLLGLVGCCALLVTGEALAQVPTGSQGGVRLDVITSRAPSLQAAASLNTTAGLYLRLESSVGGGVAWKGGRQYGAARIDGVARFTLDPFREAKHALYGLGGVSAMYDGFERWRPRLLVGFGIEGPVAHGRVAALELALGGGARIGLVLRRARPFGR